MKVPCTCPTCDCPHKWRFLVHALFHKLPDLMIKVNSFNDFEKKSTKPAAHITYFSHTTDLNINEPDSQSAKWTDRMLNIVKFFLHALPVIVLTVEGSLHMPYLWLSSQLKVPCTCPTCDCLHSWRFLVHALLVTVLTVEGSLYMPYLWLSSQLKVPCTCPTCDCPHSWRFLVHALPVTVLTVVDSLYMPYPWLSS